MFMMAMRKASCLWQKHRPWIPQLFHYPWDGKFHNQSKPESNDYIWVIYHQIKSINCIKFNIYAFFIYIKTAFCRVEEDYLFVKSNRRWRPFRYIEAGHAHMLLHHYQSISISADPPVLRSFWLAPNQKKKKIYEQNIRSTQSIRKSPISMINFDLWCICISQLM